MTHIVYIAGASSEADRVAQVRDALRDAGLTPICTWVDMVRKLGPDVDVPQEILRAGAALDVHEMEQAGSLLYVRPLTSKSEGSAAEVGWWVGHKGSRNLVMLDETVHDRPPVVFALLWARKVTTAQDAIAILKHETEAPF